MEERIINQLRLVESDIDTTDRERGIYNADNIYGEIDGHIWGDAKNVKDSVFGLDGCVSNLDGSLFRLNGRIHKNLKGKTDGKSGDLTGIYGDFSGLKGDVTNFFGDATDIEADAEEILELLKES